MLLSVLLLAAIGSVAASGDVDFDVDSITDIGPPPLGYIADQYDCPLPCTDYGNVHSWIPYHSVKRLQRCSSPLLLQLAVNQPLNDGNTDVLIRTCTLGDDSLASMNVSSDVVSPVANPKKDPTIVSPTTAPACHSSGAPMPNTLSLLQNSQTSTSAASDAVGLLSGIKAFFADQDNCNENFVFAVHNLLVIGIYIGNSLGKSSMGAVIDALEPHLVQTGVLANHTVAQLCGNGRASDRTLGISIDGTGNLMAVQKTLLGWSQGDCPAFQDVVSSGSIDDVNVYEMSVGNYTSSTNGTNPSPYLPTNLTASWNATVSTMNSTLSKRLVKRAQCHSIVVASGDSCGTLKNRCNIPAREFISFNPKPNLCSTLQPGDHICCTSGDPWQAPQIGPGPDGSCAHVQVASGDSCGSLASRCGVSGNDITKYNNAPNFCSTLQPDEYVCCGPGRPYSPPIPKKNPDGTCATHLIQNGDTCAGLAKQNNIAVTDIETWNKGKTWAWVSCSNLLLGYNMCLSEGDAPLPPPQQGTQCGPLVPGTTVQKGKSLSDYNPCPLNACCSNWGYCGPFPAHCDIHSLPGGGPGSKDPAFQTTCVSNCGMEIKLNSGPPATFQRIGYFEAWNQNRKCLWQQAKDANSDGSYTHIHWAFLGIDPQSLTPVITADKDSQQNWADFKGLTGVKRIASFGGWSSSTEPATYGIIRSAILNNRDTFAANVAKFVNDNGLDGVDFDWEYPGAPDIFADGHPIGQKGDGLEYLKFLMVMKSKLSSSQTLSIAAPASYWYLQNFPIERISRVIDYIVYMTYDLHGQWDYGNVNAFDSCSSGKCIRSHVNLTETRNTLAIITKAGVPNNKIFVGEASYGRSFHMAQNGCWGPLCEFTGSRTHSDANPGRCTDTGGYLALAEIDEIIWSGQADQQFHDGASNTDVILYKGDYVAYMTPTTKDTRRSDWKNLNFAGTIDWATDLKAFSDLDMNTIPDTAGDSNSCNSGGDLTVDSGDLCEYTCSYGFCPDSLCYCEEQGPSDNLPAVVSTAEYIAWDDFNVDLNRLCKFACKYGYCPDNICTQPVIDQDMPESSDDSNNTEGNAEQANADGCVIYTLPSLRQQPLWDCQKYCKQDNDAAQQNGETSSYSCIGFWQGASSIPWIDSPYGGQMTKGHCACNNWLIDGLADDFIDAMTAVGEIACYTFMSIIKEFVKIGLAMLPEAGQIIGTAYDMAVTAAQMAKYVYPDDQDPQGAFDWWMSPCGDTSLVPQEAIDFFNAIDTAVDYGTSFDKNIGSLGLKKGSGRKGDRGNPKDRTNPRTPNPKASHGGDVCRRDISPRAAGCAGPKPGSGGTSGGNGVQKKKRCSILPGQSVKRLGGGFNTFMKQTCVDNETRKTELVVTSLQRNPDATPTHIRRTCPFSYSQACFHYSSVIRNNPAWATLTCPPPAASVSWRLDGDATKSWKAQHTGRGWTARDKRAEEVCDRDEYPPAYFMQADSPAWLNSGHNTYGQMVRYVPFKQNRGAGSIWKQQCFKPIIQGMSNEDLEREIKAASHQVVLDKKGVTKTQAVINVGAYAAIAIDFAHDVKPPVSDGLYDNSCWPSGIAAGDPGFALLTYDQFYGGKAPPYDYAQPYVKGRNGA